MVVKLNIVNEKRSEMKIQGNATALWGETGRRIRGGRIDLREIPYVSENSI